MLVFLLPVFRIAWIIGIALVSVTIPILIVCAVKHVKKRKRQDEELKNYILSKRSRRRNPTEIEAKTKERQKETDTIDASNPLPAAYSIVKKSAAVKKVVTSGQGARGAELAISTYHPKPISKGSGHPRDKSKFAPKVTDKTTIINRTILKDYIERQRKNGIKELHFIKIKNDLNIISQTKSSRLYRLLQELVKDGLLVRKGSLYIIV